MKSGSLSRIYFLIGLMVLVVLPAIALISSCQTAAPTATAVPPPATPIPPTLTVPPPTLPPSTVVPPTPPPTTAPVPSGSKGKPLTMFMNPDFTGSGTCAVCHTRLTDPSGNDVSIDLHWRSAMMANAAHDPVYLAKVSSEIVRAPALKQVIETKCSLCHMPMAFTEAQVAGSPIAIFDDGFLNPANPLREAALDGVSCNVCHQVEKDNLGTAESFSGGFVINTSTEPPDRKSYGPFPEPFEDTMRRSVGFTPTPGLQTLSASLCAACHTLYTPYLDASGKVAGQFPEQTAFLEWQHSSYHDIGMTCQKCHMPDAAGDVLISNAPKPPRINPRAPFGQHYFVGGNVFMVRLHQNYVDELELTCSAAHLEGTLQRTLAQLQNRTLALSIEEAALSGDTLSVRLKLDSMVGHKFPTGIPLRRAWIHLVVVDGKGDVAFESGQPGPDGSIIGCDADSDATLYEPHFDLITSPDQVQIYESIMVDSEAKVTYTLLRGQTYVKDNRLLPAGFDKVTAGKDFAVAGAAASDPNFDRGSDQVSYRVNVKGHSGPFTVKAQVLFQSLSYRSTLDLARDDTEAVKTYIVQHNNTDQTPDVIASAEATVK